MAGRITKMTGWQRRKARVRKAVKGTPERPRLNVYRSNQHIYAQVIDDTTATTLVAASTKDTEISALKAKKIEAAKKVGERVGRLAVAKGIGKVVFDRSGYIYHGRVKSLAEGARAAGLNF
ncbi:MAG: 50S ribosomal protein L18 [Deltaproteobacteria bacterium]|nr:50S ribosomal protein L18 [Deltaproteobacteria bacterium]